MIPNFQNYRGSECFSLVFALLFCGLLAIGHSQTSYDFKLASSYYQSVLVQPDGKILAVAPLRASRLEIDGTTDPSFDLQSAPWFHTVALQNDGNILLGGNFSRVSDQERKSLARVFTNGSLDLDFNPGAGMSSGPLELPGTVWALTVQDDDKLLVGGSFEKLGGHATTNLGRLNRDGTPDRAFVPALSRSNLVFRLAVQRDGKILVGDGLTGVVHPGGLYRLNPDGTPDTTFQPPAAGVECMALQPDGKVLVGGSLTLPPDQTANWIHRLNADGSLDATFAGRADFMVHSLALQADGKILVGGFFTNLNGTIRPGLGRLNQDGTLDESFVPPAYQAVGVLALQGDGKILIGGSEDTNTAILGRLQNTGPASQSLASDGYSIRWLRGGTSPGVSSATFHYSTNDTDWLNLGPGTPISGGWELQGVTVPPNASIRARGRVAVAQVNNPSWFVETTARLSQPAPSIRIIHNDSSFGFHSSQFGFNVAGSDGQTIIVEACTNLTAPAWAPILTNTISGTISCFGDPQWTNYPARFYRIRSP